MTTQQKERYVPYSLDENKYIDDPEHHAFMRRYNVLMHKLNREPDQKKRNELIENYLMTIYPPYFGPPVAMRCIETTRNLARGLINQRIVQAYIFSTLTAIYKKLKLVEKAARAEVSDRKYDVATSPSKENVEATTLAQLRYVKARSSVMKIFQTIQTYLHEDSANVMEFTSEFADPPNCTNVDEYIEKLSRAEKERATLNAHYFDIIDRMQLEEGDTFGSGD